MANESGSESGSSRSGPSPAGVAGGPGAARAPPGYLLEHQAQALAHLLQLQQVRHPTMNQVTKIRVYLVKKYAKRQTIQERIFMKRGK